MYKEGVALKRKIVFPLFKTINVWKRERETEIVRQLDKPYKHFYVKYSVNSLKTFILSY